MITHDPVHWVKSMDGVILAQGVSIDTPDLLGEKFWAKERYLTKLVSKNFSMCFLDHLQWLPREAKRRREKGGAAGK